MTPTQSSVFSHMVTSATDDRVRNRLARLLAKPEAGSIVRRTGKKQKHRDRKITQVELELCLYFGYSINIIAQFFSVETTTVDQYISKWGLRHLRLGVRQ